MKRFCANRLISVIDHTMRTLHHVNPCQRENPANPIWQTPSTPAERQHAGALMRINHAGEVCAQALYHGQALMATDPKMHDYLLSCAKEENDHLHWCKQRLDELKQPSSLLNPFWYMGSFAIGALSGRLGNRWSLGFIAESERQVEAHLSTHLERLPSSDQRSRAILQQMQADEADHAKQAIAHDARPFPQPIRALMKAFAKLMTQTSYYL